MPTPMKPRCYSYSGVRSPRSSKADCRFSRRYARHIDALQAIQIRDIHGHEIPVQKTIKSQNRDINRYAAKAGMMIPAAYTGARKGTRRSFLRLAGLGAAAKVLGVAQEEKPKLEVNFDTGYVEFRAPGYYGYKAKLPAEGADMKMPKMVKKFGDYAKDTNYVYNDNSGWKLVWRDGLQNLLTMNGVEENLKYINAPTTFRFRKLPILYWVENEASLPEAFVANVKEAANMWNWRGLEILRKSDYNPWDKGEDGIVFRVCMCGAAAATIEGEIWKYPKKVVITYPITLMEFDASKGLASHEFGHAIAYGRGPPPHSRFAGDMMFKNNTQSIRQVENEGAFILYTWEPQTDTGGFIIEPNPADSIDMTPKNVW